VEGVVTVVFCLELRVLWCAIPFVSFCLPLIWGDLYYCEDRRSRALGDSSRLALHQGLEWYDQHTKTYKVGKFFSVRDAAMRAELSQLKEDFPELPVDAGNLYRAF